MRIVRIDRREAQRLYERFSAFSGLPEYRGREGRLYFLSALFDSVLVVEYPYGIVRFSDYRPPQSIRVHGLFDGKQVFGAREELRELARMVFAHLRVKRIECIVPSEKRALGRLLEKIGFVRETTVTNGTFNGTMYKRAAIYRMYKED